MPLRKIVVGVDLSTGAENAAYRAAEVAAQTGAELVLVHAATVPDVPEVPASMKATADALRAVLTDRLATDRADLADLRERLEGLGATVSQLLVDRDPDDAIVEAAAELHADLVVVGTRDDSRLRRWLLGSVSEHVVRAAACSVLVTREGDPDRGFERLVVGTDFSPAAENALARAVELARPGATIDVVHCFQVPLLTLSSTADTAPVDGYETLRSELLADAHTRGDAALASHAGAPVILRFHLVEESPREAVCDMAEQVHADLVVVGHHGRRGLRRVLLGSVAEAVVRHAPCSVLVAR
jgi:nucleotide-binding universal stress UspA family protein